MNLRQQLSKLTALLGRRSSAGKRRPSQRRRLRLEPMEARRLLAVVDLATLTAAQGSIVYGAEAGDHSGYSVSSAGDVNGDGFDDLLIGADRAGASGNSKFLAGESYLVFGAASLPASIDLANLGTAGITIFGMDAFDYSGNSVSNAGDVNGDGFDDLLIGAHRADASGNLKTSAGESYVIFGAASLPATIDLANLDTAGMTIFGADASDNSGRSVSSAGDVNGDGFDDLLIGADHADASGNSKSSAGDSYLIFGAASPPVTINLAELETAGITIFGADASDNSGRSVSSAGDVNGDGFDDLLIGAYRADASANSKSLAGESYLIFGAATMPATIDLANLGTAGITIFGLDGGDYSGNSVSSAGDVNGDGFDDLLIGAYRADASANSIDAAGDCYLIFGAASLPATINLANLNTAGIMIFGTASNDLSGSSVSSAGDVNGDGFDDLLIGASGADASGNSKSGAGDSYVIFGAASLSVTNCTIGLTIFGADAIDYSGISVSSAGDVNGDGFDDLLVGAHYADASGNSKETAGESYVIFGGDFTASVTHLGTAAANTLTGTSAADVMNGARGDDILIGSGGADVLTGGQGNDILAVSDLTFQRIIGGTGTDTLRLDGTNQSLDLTTVRDNRLLSIEQIDITGSGDNMLTLTQRDVLNISDTTNTLIVQGNSGDKVLLESGWLRGTDEVIGATTYRVLTNGTATLKVAISIFLPNTTIDLATLTASQGTTLFGADTNDNSGWSVSCAGDVNGDGFDDLLIGAVRADASANSKVYAGESYVIFGAASLPATIDLANLGTAGITIFGAVAVDYSGRSVSSAGDVNGDGFDDLLIGADRADTLGNSKNSAGESYVIFGAASLPATIDLANLGTAGITIFGAEPNDNSGFSVSNAGDVNGDGFDDLLVGAYRADASANSKNSAGESYVIFGAASLPATIDLANLGTTGITIFGAEPNDNSGFSVSNAGDVNGDGFDDLLIGARNAAARWNFKSGAGDSYVIFGAASLPATIDLANLGTTGITIFGAEPNDNSGFSVSNAGDVNGDGFDDLLVGAYRADASENNKNSAGESYVIFGAASLPATIDLANLGTAGITIFGADAYDYSGRSVSSAGDVNGDGFDDLLIGAKNAAASESSKSHAGDSYVIFGAASLPETIDLANLGAAGITIFGAFLFNLGGISVSSAGDVNGDGFDDLLIGAYKATSSYLKPDAGKSYLIFGGDFTASVTHQGTEAANTLTGTSAANIMNGARGDDTVIGSGGADVLTGGQGNDILAVSDLTFKRIIGGTGTDTFRLDGANQSLNLTTIRDNRILGIEQIDITGSGNNTLTLTQREVLNLSDESNTLVVRRDAADIVNIGTGWTQGPSENVGVDIFDVYTQGTATLKVRTFFTFGIVATSAVKAEGNAATTPFTFTVTRSGPTTSIGSVNYAVTGSAANPADAADFSGNVLPSGTVTFAAGVTSQLVTINVLGDTVGEQNEGFIVMLNTPSAAGTIGTATATGTIQNDDNRPPGIGSITNAVTYTENAPRVLVFGIATVTDLDNLPFTNGKLTITNTNGQTTDSLAIIPTTAVTVSNGNVLYNNVVIGSFAGGMGTTPLVFTFNNQANAARIQLVLRAIGFADSSETPATTARSISVVVNDGMVAGNSVLQSKLVNVISVNDVPVVGSITNAVTYTENAPRVLVFGVATVTDLDNLPFTNGKLTVANTNGQTTDSLAIIPTSVVTVSGTNVLYNNTVIGSFTGGTGTTPLVFTFNNQANAARIQFVLRAIGFADSSENPVVTARSISVVVNDGTANSVSQSKLVSVVGVNDAPVVGSIGNDVTYQKNALPVLVFGTATVNDVDTTLFTNGKLTITNTNGQATDTLAIVVTAAVTVSGSSVLYNSVAIGSFTGGTGQTPLVFTFNNQANSGRIQLVLRAIGFADSSSNPVTTARSILVVVNDGLLGGRQHIAKQARQCPRLTRSR